MAQQLKWGCTCGACGAAEGVDALRKARVLAGARLCSARAAIAVQLAGACKQAHLILTLLLPTNGVMIYWPGKVLSLQVMSGSAHQNKEPAIVYKVHVLAPDDEERVVQCRCKQHREMFGSSSAVIRKVRSLAAQRAQESSKCQSVLACTWWHRCQQATAPSRHFLGNESHMRKAPRQEHNMQWDAPALEAVSDAGLSALPPGSRLAGPANTRALLTVFC
jgi:hypothetical protein